jgi:hypothetical protein
MNEERQPDENLDIEDHLLHLAAEDKVDLTFQAGGEMAARLTDKGLAAAEKAIGGKDVADVAGALTVMLANIGDCFGNRITDEEGIPTWLKMVQIARLWKYLHGMDWDDIVEKLKTDFPKKAK